MKNSGLGTRYTAPAHCMCTYIIHNLKNLRPVLIPIHRLSSSHLQKAATASELRLLKVFYPDRFCFTTKVGVSDRLPNDLCVYVACLSAIVMLIDPPRDFGCKLAAVQTYAAHIRFQQSLLIILIINDVRLPLRVILTFTKKKTTKLGTADKMTVKPV